MTSTILFKFLCELIAICAVTYMVYRRDAVARFEKKAWVYIKAFFLALRDVLRDAKAKRKPAPKGNVIRFDSFDILESTCAEANEFEISVA